MNVYINERILTNKWLTDRSNSIVFPKIFKTDESDILISKITWKLKCYFQIMYMILTLSSI